MKQYLQGLGCIAVLILVTGAAALAGRPFVSPEGMEALIGGVFLLGAVSLGYVYKRWNGSLIFTKDGKGFTRLFPFLFGVGTILGPLKLFLGPFPVPDVIPLINMLLLVLSVPLSGMSALGAMLVGSVFYKREPTWL